MAVSDQFIIGAVYPFIGVDKKTRLNHIAVPVFSLRDVERNKAPKIAPDFGSSTRHIRRCISGSVPVDVTQ